MLLDYLLGSEETVMNTSLVFSSSADVFGMDVSYTYKVDEKTNFVLRGFANKEKPKPFDRHAGEYIRGSLVHHFRAASVWPVDVKLIAWAAQGKNLDRWGAKAVAVKTLEVDEDTEAEARLVISNRPLTEKRNTVLYGSLKRVFRVGDDEWLSGVQCRTDGRCVIGVRNGMLSVQKVLSQGGATGEPGEWRAKYTLSGPAPKLFF